MKLSLALLALISVVAALPVDLQALQGAPGSLQKIDKDLLTLQELKEEHIDDLFKEISLIKKIRAGRSVERTCGAKMMIRAAKICVGKQIGGSNVDLSTNCCNKPCNDEYFKSVTCPEK